MYEHAINIPKTERFRVTSTIPKKSRKSNRSKAYQRNQKRLRQRQQRILNRIKNRPGPERDQPMMTATKIHYEMAERVQGLSAGGIGAMLLVARAAGLIDEIDLNLLLHRRQCERGRDTLPADRFALEITVRDCKEIVGAGQQQVPFVWASIGAFHLRLWTFTMTEARAWNRGVGELVNRQAAPWDNPDRRPSHADKRRAWRRELLNEE